jgi:hypothetical protein
MRTVFGIIFGAVLTIALVYAHDSMATTQLIGISSTSKPGAIANWDVAAFEWQQVKSNVHTAWLKLKSSTNG